jgi:acyl-CoA thioester hydrolase
VKGAAPQRSEFAWWSQEKLRNADTDQFVHVNHAVLCTFFEAGRLQLFSGEARSLMDGASLAVVHLELDFLREVHFPGTIDIGTRVVSFGTTSIRFSQALFAGDECAATARAVCVLLHPATHRAHPVPIVLRNHLLADVREPAQ